MIMSAGLQCVELTSPVIPGVILVGIAAAWLIAAALAAKKSKEL